MVQPIPDEYPRVTPVLYVRGGAEAIDFYREVLGAAVRMRIDTPGGTVGHAELEIGDSLLMLADESPEMGTAGPETHGGTPVTLHVYVEEVDDVFRRALEGGATEIQPVQDQFYGDRSGTFEDPFGHRWNVATHVEDVPDDEMAARAQQAMAEMPDGASGG